jgi:hypothetical protein
LCHCFAELFDDAMDEAEKDDRAARAVGAVGFRFRV